MKMTLSKDNSVNEKAANTNRRLITYYVLVIFHYVLIILFIIKTIQNIFNLLVSRSFFLYLRQNILSL